MFSAKTVLNRKFSTKVILVATVAAICLSTPGLVDVNVQGLQLAKLQISGLKPKTLLTVVPPYTVTVKNTFFHVEPAVDDDTSSNTSGSLSRFRMATSQRHSAPGLLEGNSNRQKESDEDTKSVVIEAKLLSSTTRLSPTVPIRSPEFLKSNAANVTSVSEPASSSSSAAPLVLNLNDSISPPQHAANQNLSNLSSTVESESAPPEAVPPVPSLPLAPGCLTLSSESHDTNQNLSLPPGCPSYGSLCHFYYNALRY